MSNKHSFHIVDISPWPLINSLNSMNLMIETLVKASYYNCSMFSLSSLYFIMSLMLTSFMWWRDILREGAYQGHHTFSVYTGMKLSMLLFITSEIMFFFSFFWSFLHFSLSPDIELGNIWPPQGIFMINPYQMPLLNTIILLSSGATVTMAHYSILKKKYNNSMNNLTNTIFLGLIFSMLQFMEYNWTEFSMSDSAFGSIFFMATGFHGLHVLIGTCFLSVNFYRLYINQFSNLHHFSFEAAAWYWHFVDIVWIYLYILIYWWFFFLINMMSMFNFQLKSF